MARLDSRILRLEKRRADGGTSRLLDDRQARELIKGLADSLGVEVDGLEPLARRHLSPEECRELDAQDGSERAAVLLLTGLAAAKVARARPAVRGGVLPGRSSR
jgi:hypothetical protein